MSVESTDLIQARLLQAVAELPPARQEEVLDFAMFLRQLEQTRRWEAISDGEAAALKAEFADEDLALAEATLTDYLPTLQREEDEV